MSKKKDFNKGLETGIRISEKFMEQKCEENHRIMEKIERIHNTQEGLRDAVRQVLDYNEGAAIEKYYGICNELSPKDLPDAEKHILLDILATVSVNADSLNPYQKQFFSNLKHYIQLLNYSPNTDYDFENIENMRDLDCQIIILKCIREFLFLNYCDFSFGDEYEELFDIFDVNQKRIRHIDDMIELTYDLFDESGIIGMYGDHTLVDSYDLLDEEEELIDIKLEKQIVDEKITIKENEEIIFENKAIYFRADIECEGKIIFRNCQLHYYETGITSQIFMGQKAYMELQNCSIRCYELKHSASDNRFMTIDERYFVLYDRKGFLDECKFMIRNCIFAEASYFLYCYCGKGLRLDKNEFIDSYALFYSVVGEEAVITNCYLSCKGVPQYIKSRIDSIKFDLNPIFMIWNAKYWNCRFEGDEEFVYNNGDDYGCDLIEGAKEIVNCSFVNLNNYIFATKLVGCRFENCSNIYEGNGLMVQSEEKHIVDCLFVKCSKILALGRNAIVEKCQFLQCANALIYARGRCRIVSCEFYNIAVLDRIYDNFVRGMLKGMDGIDGTAILLGGEKGQECIDIEKCEFNGVQISDKAYLIEVDSYAKLPNSIGRVKKCELVNVCNKSGNLCKSTYSYWGLFNKRHTETGLMIILSDSFLKVDRGDGICKSFTVKENDVYGKPIGANENIEKEISGKMANFICWEALVV